MLDAKACNLCKNVSNCPPTENCRDESLSVAAHVYDRCSSLSIPLLIHTWYANAGKVAEYCECSKPLTIVQGVFIDIASGEKITETFVAITCLFIFLLLSSSFPLFFFSYFFK